MDLVFRALADGTRRRILDLLARSPRTTGDLCARFPVSRYAVMKHLTVLERAGLLVVRRRGRQRFNHLNPVPLQNLHERWMRPHAERWASSLLALKRSLEQKGEATMPWNDGPFAFGTLSIELEVHVNAAPERVFDALTGDVSAWWGRPYVHSERARAVHVEPKVGGRCWEDWGGGEGALYATVTKVERPRLLRLDGPFGMSGLCHSVVTYSLEAAAAGTLVKVSHSAAGEIDEEARRDYTMGWEDLLRTRFPAFVERGEKLGLGHEPAPFGGKGQ